MFLFLSRQLRLVWINSFSYISSLSSPSIPLFLPLYFGGSSNSVFSSCCSCAPPPRLFISLAVSRERTQHVNFNKGRKRKHQSFFSHLLSYPISRDTQLYDGNKNVMSHTSNYARHKMYFTTGSSPPTLLQVSSKEKGIICKATRSSEKDA